MKTNETIYDTYQRVICSTCKNKNNNLNLCEIRRKIDGSICCCYYDREGKAEGYKDKVRMYITANRNKPIMKGIER